MALRSGLRSFSTIVSSPRRVAVIGAGPAGIAATSQLLTLNDHCASPCFGVTLFDRRSNFSGVWDIDPNPGPCVIRYDANGRARALWSREGKAVKDGDVRGRFRPPGAMYEGLRTNLTCDIMAYRSTPFNEEIDLFPTRATVEDYLNRFGESTVKDREGLEVRLETAVNDVRRISHEEDRQRIGGGSKWSVKSIDVHTGEETQGIYDHVVVASGRCSTPTIPPITNLAKFQGQILHSAWYRSPLPFRGSTVLVVGNSSSGSDIARELSGYILRTLPEGHQATEEYMAKCKTDRPVRILHCYEDFHSPPALDYDPREPDSPEWSKKIQVVPKMQRITDEGRVVFEDGSEESVDTIIFGTGYACDFPYLDQNVAPFDRAPLLPPAPQAKTQAERTEQENAQAYVPPSRTAPFLTNLDDWFLFYSPDPSICILGVPFKIVPMPFTQLQSRIVAAGWAGKIQPSPESSGLPRLDTTIPTTDPQRWTSAPAKDRPADANSNHKAVFLGYPSDKAYQNTLLSMLPAELRQAGKDQAKKVPVQADGHESLRPVGGTDEGWAMMPEFRNQRRAEAKRLRRILLGY